MTAEEMDIVQFLKHNPEAYFARKEISRKARSRQEYDDNPHWAAAPLNSLVMQGYIEQNESGHYKICAKHAG